MEIQHRTPFSASLDAILDKDGSTGCVAVLKATFELGLDGTLRPAGEQVPVTPGDVYNGDPAKTSPLDEGDGAFYKPGTDIVAIGSVHAPRGRAVATTDASLTVGPINKIVRVFGDRVWSFSSVLGAKMPAPKPFTEMPITWDRSFGGWDTFHPDPSRHRLESRNPVGTGFRITRSSEALEGLALPNFEDPRHAIRNWDDKPAPAGLGFTGRGWMPRVKYAGTYDDAWQKNRMPILPEDFDYRFFNGAPPDQITAKHLEGGEDLEAVNLSPRGTDRFRLPRLRVQFQAVSLRKRVTVPGVLDTVRLMLDRSRIVLLWRAKYRVHPNEPGEPATALVEMVG